MADDGEDAVGLGLVDAFGLGGFGDEFLAEEFGDAQGGHLGFEGLEFGHLGLEAGGVGLDVIRFVARLHAEGVVDAEGGLAAVLVPAL